jgi:hypothetical protein
MQFMQISIILDSKQFSCDDHLFLACSTKINERHAAEQNPFLKPKVISA